jgi:hypothetical protein
MASPFKRALILALSILLLTGCASFRIMGAREGGDVEDPAGRLQPGRSGLGEILSLYGAPTEVHNLGGEILLVYEKMQYRGGQMTVGIPLSDVIPTSINLSGHGDLIRYDTAAFFLRSRDHVLLRTAYVRGSSHPFWNAFWTDARPGDESDRSPQKHLPHAP